MIRSLSHRLVAALLSVVLWFGQDSPARAVDPAPAPIVAASPAATPPVLTLREGKVTLENGLVDINLPKEFRYLDKTDARKVLVDAWHNPPRVADDVLGMVVPAAFGPDTDDAWGVIITYEASGYVKDDEASKLDYGKMLTQMQEATRENNKKRATEGYPPIELVGWATPPRYDAANKKLYWAKELQFGENKDRPHTLNYDVRILGRRGVLVLRAIAGMDQLDAIRDATPQLLAAVNYNEGHRYADFDSKTDKVATYGLGALILGGVAAKAGLFKVLLGVLIAAKKFVVIGAVAAAGFVKRLFGGGQKEK